MHGRARACMHKGMPKVMAGFGSEYSTLLSDDEVLPGTFLIYISEKDRESNCCWAQTRLRREELTKPNAHHRIPIEMPWPDSPRAWARPWQPFLLRPWAWPWPGPLLSISFVECTCAFCMHMSDYIILGRLYMHISVFLICAISGPMRFKPRLRTQSRKV